MRRCLVVDDADVVRKVAHVILKDAGFEVVEAGTGCEAIEHCQASLPDAVILDWHLPDMSGLELMDKLQRAVPERLPYILYCTTENDAGDIARARERGASDILLKPFSRSELEAKIARSGLA